MKNGCIVHLPKSPLVILRDDYLRICTEEVATKNAVQAAAIILAIIEYWTDVKLAEAEEVARKNQAREQRGLAPLWHDLWVYKSYDHFIQDSLGLLKKHDIKDALPILMRKGFITKRANPDAAWDRIPQYLLCVDEVNSAIARLQKPQPIDSLHRSPVPDASGTGDDSKGYLCPLDQSYLPDRSGTSARTIPETTTKITAQNTTTTDVVVSAKETSTINQAALDRIQAELARQELIVPDKVLKDLLYKFSVDRVLYCAEQMVYQIAKGITPREKTIPYKLLRNFCEQDREGTLAQPAGFLSSREKCQQKHQQAAAKAEQKRAMEFLKEDRVSPEYIEQLK